MSRRHLTWIEKGGCVPKPCKACQTSFKPATSGHLYCGPCGVVAHRSSHTRAMRVQRAKNREHHRRIKARWDLKQYGMTIATYEQMVIDQAGACAICHRVPTTGRGVLRKLAVDHCHRTSQVRGLLCSLCNTAIGLLGEDVERFFDAVKYLWRAGLKGAAIVDLEKARFYIDREIQRLHKG